MQECDECLRLEGRLQESGLDYLAAANRYNTWRSAGLDLAWAAETLRTAKIANDVAQRQFDEHVEKHARPARMAVGA